MNPWSQAVKKWKKNADLSDHEIAVMSKVTPQAVTQWRGGSVARPEVRRRLERASKGKVKAKLGLGIKRRPRRRSRSRSKG